MKNPKRIRKYLFISLLVLISLLVIFLSGYTVFNTIHPSKSCASCHEIRESYETWTLSAHRAYDCKTCHGTALSTGINSLRESAGRIKKHFREPLMEDVRLSEKQVGRMVSRCRKCHEDEFSNWTSGGHSMRFTDVLLNGEQNRQEPLSEQCLRCHGMFYQGAMEGLVTPLDTTGPWKIVSPNHTGRYAIPCMACHSMHTPGQPARPPDYNNPGQQAYHQPAYYPKAGFYDRTEKTHVRADELPRPRFLNTDREVLVSEEPLMRICVQCHAPNAFHPEGLSDDCTPMGVHEGLSCASCHRPHTNDARASCKTCHPVFSNCGLDVEQMNTTFADSTSRNDIHSVTCTGCHPGRK